MRLRPPNATKSRKATGLCGTSFLRGRLISLCNGVYPRWGRLISLRNGVYLHGGRLISLRNGVYPHGGRLISLRNNK